jgi:hypothetical protein
VLASLGQKLTQMKVQYEAVRQRVWIAAIVDGSEDWGEVALAAWPRVGSLLSRRGAAIVELVLSWMVGLPHRPLERQPRLEAARSLMTTAVPIAWRVILVPADVHRCHRIWGCESGFHRSRLLLSIPCRGSQASRVQQEQG